MSICVANTHKMSYSQNIFSIHVKKYSNILNFDFDKLSQNLLGTANNLIKNRKEKLQQILKSLYFYCYNFLPARSAIQYIYDIKCS